jgi:hypothetical protein
MARLFCCLHPLDKHRNRAKEALFRHRGQLLFRRGRIGKFDRQDNRLCEPQPDALVGAGRDVLIPVVESNSHDIVSINGPYRLSISKYIRKNISNILG